MNMRLKATLVVAIAFALLVCVVPVALAAVGDYYTISVSDNGGPFRQVWSGASLSSFSGVAEEPTLKASDVTALASSGSNSAEYEIRHKNILGQTLYYLRNSLSWSWTSTGQTTITNRHYHYGNYLGWSWVHLENSASGYGTGYCYGKYKGHFYYSSGLQSATAYPGLNVRGNSGGSHSASQY